MSDPQSAYPRSFVAATVGMGLSCTAVGVNQFDGPTWVVWAVLLSSLVVVLVLLPLSVRQDEKEAGSIPQDAVGPEDTRMD